MSQCFKVFLLIFQSCLVATGITLGIDTFLENDHSKPYTGKKIGVITNHTAISKDGSLTIDRLLGQKHLTITKIFAPEHGFFGDLAAEKIVKDDLYEKKIPILSLYGATRRPTKEMLKDIDVLIFDMQDNGVRSYTYTSTLFYCMEEAAKYGIEVLVLDRPNPMGGEMFDGPGMVESLRSFIGYINVPYCHGMTVAELAHFFNTEYNVKCKLKSYNMKGWKRSQTFKDTDLLWVPSSPNMPEAETAFYYATTGWVGSLSLAYMGIGTTFPFKVIGAPWIDGKNLAKILNKQDLKGVIFTPFSFTPNLGSMKNILCTGVMIHITDFSIYKPMKTGCMIAGILKSIYPKETKDRLDGATNNLVSIANKALGNETFLNILKTEPFPAYKLIEEGSKDLTAFSQKREKYLLYK